MLRNKVTIFGNGFYPVGFSFISQALFHNMVLQSCLPRLLSKSMVFCFYATAAVATHKIKCVFNLQMRVKTECRLWG